MKVMNSDPDIKQLIGSGCGKIMRIWMRILNAAPKERRKQENEKILDRKIESKGYKNEKGNIDEKLRQKI